jgi:hypothetical protein
VNVRAFAPACRVSGAVCSGGDHQAAILPHGHERGNGHDAAPFEQSLLAQARDLRGHDAGARVPIAPDAPPNRLGNRGRIRVFGHVHDQGRLRPVADGGEAGVDPVGIPAARRGVNGTLRLGRQSPVPNQTPKASTVRASARMAVVVVVGQKAKRMIINSP